MPKQAERSEAIANGRNAREPGIPAVEVERKSSEIPERLARAGRPE
jgi:hypothetical protein